MLVCLLLPLVLDADGRHVLRLLQQTPRVAAYCADLLNEERERIEREWRGCDGTDSDIDMDVMDNKASHE